MSGPIRMYAMRQIVRHDVPVKLPTCMYHLPNIHGATDDDDIDNAAKRKNGTACSARRPNPSATNAGLVNEQNNQEMAMEVVQQRQEVILQQLEDLKKQMGAIRDSLCSANTPCNATAGKKKVEINRSNNFHVKQLPTDIAINANPSNPPYSLLLLQKVWKNAVSLNIQSFMHSTVTNLPYSAQAFVQSIPEAQPVSNLPCLTVRLIWKAIGINQLELSGSRPILGEVNLLRYLARLTSTLGYDENSDMDYYLDTCYNIARSKTKSERQPLLQRFTKKLAKSQFIFGQFSIVDIAAYSVIKLTTGAGEINASLTKWMKNCESCD